MAFDIFTLITFAVPTSISPGPNNISAMSFSMSLGIKRTFKYILGIGVGTFLVMLICAWLSIGFANWLPELFNYLKYLGAAYIIYLAWKSFTVSLGTLNSKLSNPRFIDGVVLQLINPKALLFGLTIFSTFFSSYIENILIVCIAALGLSVFTFLIVSSWAIFGSFICRYLRIPWVKKVFGFAMALCLVYVALKIIFIPSL